MDHNGIPFGLHFHQQPAHPAVAHSHLLGRPFLRNLPFFDAFQPIQPIPFLLAHRDSFHPSSLAAVKRNFLLCPIRNFSLCRDTRGGERRKNGVGVIEFRRMSTLSRRTFLGGAALTASAFRLPAEAMGIPSGTQTYPFRNEFAKDIPGTLKALADIGTRRIELCSPWSYREFAGFKDYKPADLKKLLDSNNIVAESCHYGMPELKSNLDERVAWARELGMKQMILASMPIPRQNAT